MGVIAGDGWTVASATVRYYGVKVEPTRPQHRPPLKKLPGERIGERRVRQMCAAGEIAGAEQTESGRWRIPAATVHAMLQDRRDRLERQDRIDAPERPPESPAPAIRTGFREFPSLGS